MLALSLWVSAQALGDTHTPNLTDDIHVAVLAYDDPKVVVDQLMPFVHGTERLMPDVDIHLHVVSFDSLEEGVDRSRFDLLVTDPYHYLRLRELNSLARAFATVYRHSDAGQVSSLGGTIVARAERDDLRELRDLRGKTVAVPDRRSASGFALPLAELRDIGVDRSDLRWFDAGSDNLALQAVQAGEADVAFLRSGLLESLVHRGELDVTTLKVLNRQDLADFPFAVSTKLVPEWPLVYMGGSRPKLMLRLLGMALQRPGKLEITTLGALAGILPLADYAALEDAVRELALPPFDSAPRVSLADIWNAHRTGVIAVSCAVLTIAALLVALAERNRRLRGVWRDLRGAHRELEQDRRRLADLNRHFELFLERTTDFIYFKDASRRFIFASAAMARLTGSENRRDMEGKTDLDVFPPDIAQEYYEQETELFETRKPLIDQRQRYQRPDGSPGWVSTYKWPVLSPEGDQVLGLFGISRDITLLHDHEQQLEQAAHYDALTGLPNRSLLFDRLGQAMAAAERRNTEIALVYLDLDHFKEINDRLGHAAGDELLASVAETMQARLRRSDTVARIGGDEFVALLGDLSSRKECVVLLDRLLVAIANPISIAGETVSVTASAGLAFYRGGMNFGPDRLLREADQAMYRAKEGGRNRYRVLDETLGGRDDFLERFTRAFEQGEFEVAYQPVVDMQEGTVLGAEALLRWRQSDGRLLLPDEFLPVILGHPLALELERWVMREALQQQQRWHAAGLAVGVHVNVTASDISQPGFVSQLRALLQEVAESSPHALTLEILESAAVSDGPAVNDVIDGCRELGVSFALDDFGTGYSSLAHIKDLRADCVKIDKRFVQSMYASYDDFSLLAAILAMARAFDRDVVAEGVESIEQGRMLLQLGCRVGQGFAIARPMDAEHFLQWSQEWQPHPSWLGFEIDESTVLSDGFRGGRASWQKRKEQITGT